MKCFQNFLSRIVINATARIMKWQQSKTYFGSVKKRSTKYSFTDFFLGQKVLVTDIKGQEHSPHTHTHTYTITKFSHLKLVIEQEHVYILFLIVILLLWNNHVCVYIYILYSLNRIYAVQLFFYCSSHLQKICWPALSNELHTFLFVAAYRLGSCALLAAGDSQRSMFSGLGSH